MLRKQTYPLYGLITGIPPTLLVSSRAKASSSPCNL